VVFRFVLDTILFRRRYQIAQGVRHTLGLLREITLYPDYDWIAFKILEARDEVHTVIFGHTHILRYRQWREGKEYFNEGSWNEVTNLDLSDYGTKTRLSYASIEYGASGELGEAGGSGAASASRPRVKLKQWHGLWKPEQEILV
jgi:hypothetical protein